VTGVVHADESGHARMLRPRGEGSERPSAK
jgi:hypothetical protein